MRLEKATFRSAVNGVVFDSVSPTTNMLLGNHNKSQFVSQCDGTAVAKGKGKEKVKVTIGAEDDAEQELH